MKKYVVGVYAFLICSASVFSQQSGKTEQLIEILKAADIPGIQLIYSKNNHVEIYNLGTIGHGSLKPVTTNTIFEAASLSKAVLAYAVFRLIDRGLLQLDTALLRYIGHVDRFDPANPDYEKITARMVLRHTTGFPNWGDSARLNFLFPPDSCFSYSGEGYVFLQRVIEHLTGKPLNQIAEEEVFGPLHMQSSSFSWKVSYAGMAAFPDEESKWHIKQNAAYSLLTTAHDYNIFLQALLKGTGLTTKSHQLMFEQSTPGNWYNHPVTDATTHIGWGLGVGIQQNEKGKSIWQWGDNGNFRAYYIAFPATDESLVYFTHSSNGHFITAEIIDMFFGRQTSWGVKWIGEGYDDPPAMKVYRSALLSRGFDHAANVLEDVKKQNPQCSFSEHDLNAYGYILMQSEPFHAVDILTLNVSLHPGSADALESLGEGYLAADNKEAAALNFKKCLVLDPKQRDAIDQLKKLNSP
jgi:CubicO group peptidase (beta-lactamase class C family)